MRQRAAGLGRQTDDALRSQLKQRRRRNDFADQNCVVWKLFERRQRSRSEIVKQAPYDIFEIASPFPQVFIVEPVVSLEEIVADQLNRPFRIDRVGFDLLDDAVDKQPVLEHEQMSIDEKGRFPSACPPELRLHSLELLARLLNRLPESIDFFPHPIGPKLQIERNEEGIKGSDGSADGKSNRTCDTVDDSFRHFILGNSQKKAQKSQKGFLCFLCFFVANFLPRQILTDALYGLLFIDAAGANSDFRTIPCRQQQDAQDASRIGFNGVCWIGSK